jgi:tetratricopeptide (TPR) repeat protein
MRENKYAEAEESFRKSIELMPGYALSHHELGTLLVHSGKWEPAAAEFTQAVTLDPTFTAAYYQLSRVYAHLGEKEKSEAMLNEFNERSQQDASNDAQAAERARDDDTRKETEF